MMELLLVVKDPCKFPTRWVHGHLANGSPGQIMVNILPKLHEHKGVDVVRQADIPVDGGAD